MNNTSHATYPGSATIFFSLLDGTIHLTSPLQPFFLETEAFHPQYQLIRPNASEENTWNILLFDLSNSNLRYLEVNHRNQKRCLAWFSHISDFTQIVTFSLAPAPAMATMDRGFLILVWFNHLFPIFRILSYVWILLGLSTYAALIYYYYYYDFFIILGIRSWNIIIVCLRLFIFHEHKVFDNVVTFFFTGIWMLPPETMVPPSKPTSWETNISKG